MKQTKKLEIKHRIFRACDLKRISAVFDRQKQSAEDSNQNYHIKYTVSFDDQTSFESDSSVIFDDSSIVETKRPVAIGFVFFNHSLSRHMEIELTHGNLNYRNYITVSGKESSWVNDNFTKLKEIIEGAESQSSWLSKHPHLLLNVMALCVGSLAILTITTFAYSIAANKTPSVYVLSEAVSKLKFAHNPAFHIFGFFFSLSIGYAFGAYNIYQWFISAWPNIELDFGADHLKREKRIRERIAAITALVIIPVLIALAL